MFLKALEVARERLWQATQDEESTVADESTSGSAEPPAAVARPSRVEALLAVADASLARDGERSGGDRYQVVVHVDAATLTSAARGSCVLEDGPPVAVETVRRLSCDSSLVALLEGADRLLGVGRKTRAVPPSLRRALKARDGCCRFPGCTNTRGLDAHHLEHWADGGPTELANLILLCRRHHRLVHEGGWTVDHAGLFRDPFGLPSPARPRDTQRAARGAPGAERATRARPPHRETRQRRADRPRLRQRRTRPDHQTPPQQAPPTPRLDIHRIRRETRPLRPRPHRHPRPERHHRRDRAPRRPDQPVPREHARPRTRTRRASRRELFTN